jgi:hypothetical protein
MKAIIMLALIGTVLFMFTANTVYLTTVFTSAFMKKEVKHEENGVGFRLNTHPRLHRRTRRIHKPLQADTIIIRSETWRSFK